MNFKIIILLMFFAQLSSAQNIMIGEVQQITNGNTFVIIHENREYKVQIKDSQILQKVEAVRYLRKKILHKEVILLEINKSNEHLSSNAVMYNCKPSPDKESEIPCVEANNLNVEMFMYKYLKYIGDNEFLKEISNI